MLPMLVRKFSLYLLAVLETFGRGRTVTAAQSEPKVLGKLLAWMFSRWSMTLAVFRCPRQTRLASLEMIMETKEVLETVHQCRHQPSTIMLWLLVVVTCTIHSG